MSVSLSLFLSLSLPFSPSPPPSLSLTPFPLCPGELAGSHLLNHHASFFLRPILLLTVFPTPGCLPPSFLLPSLSVIVQQPLPRTPTSIKKKQNTERRSRPTVNKAVLPRSRRGCAFLPSFLLSDACKIASEIGSLQAGSALLALFLDARPRAGLVVKASTWSEASWG